MSKNGKQVAWAIISLVLRGVILGAFLVVMWKQAAQVDCMLILMTAVWVYIVLYWWTDWREQHHYPKFKRWFNDDDSRPRW